jgi:hypothetical protein
MKTLSEVFALVVITVITTFVVVSCCNFPLITDTTSYVEIGHNVHGKIPERTYVTWKNPQKFEEALTQLSKDGGKICICVLPSSGSKPHRHNLSNDCPPGYKCPSEQRIRTVNVTKSKTANNTVAAESVANDPNVTWKIQGNPEDLNNVLNTLGP